MLTASILAATVQGYFTVALVCLFAIIGAVVGWKISNLMMPPRDKWTKSYFSILSFKLGVAAGGAYLSVVLFSYLASWLFGK